MSILDFPDVLSSPEESVPKRAKCTHDDSKLELTLYFKDEKEAQDVSASKTEGAAEAGSAPAPLATLSTETEVDFPAPESPPIIKRTSRSVFSSSLFRDDVHALDPLSKESTDDPEVKRAKESHFE
jgi:hypothetical protein